jgi:fucose permease
MSPLEHSAEAMPTNHIQAVASALELCVLFVAFRHENAFRYREEKQCVNVPAHVDVVETGVLRNLATWLCALYLLAYVGTETAISGWIVSFMIRQRKAPESTASLASSGYWSGMAVGRFTLGVVTDRLGVGRATVYYFVTAIAIQSVFAFVHTPIASITLQVFLGFVMGPMFASGIVSITRVLPAHQHIPAVAFVVSAGQIGAALLPFAIGAFVEALGIGLYPFAVIILAILSLITWVPVLRQQPVGSVDHNSDEEVSDENDMSTP